MKEWPLPQSHGRGRRAGASPCNGRHYFCSQFIGQYKSPGQAWDRSSPRAGGEVAVFQVEKPGKAHFCKEVTFAQRPG